MLLPESIWNLNPTIERAMPPMADTPKRLCLKLKRELCAQTFLFEKFRVL